MWLFTVDAYPVLRGVWGWRKKTSHLFGLNLLPCKVCLPVNSEVADKRGRKYASVDMNLRYLDLEPEPSVRFVTTISRTNDGTRPVKSTQNL